MFIGAGTVVLPNVTIGNDVIIGANSTVTHDLPDGVVAVGSPARVICSTEEYLNKERERMKTLPVFGEEYTMRGGITENMKEKMRREIQRIGGYVD